MDFNTLKSVSDLPAPFRSPYSFRQFLVVVDYSLQVGNKLFCKAAGHLLIANFFFIKSDTSIHCKVNVSPSASTRTSTWLFQPLVGVGRLSFFELCMLRLLSRFLTTDFKFNHAKGTLKTIYVAPSKALVQEKLRDWSQNFGALGINFLELTGDNDFYNVRDVQDADIILHRTGQSLAGRSQKFDAVTRYWMKNGGLSFFSDIALLLIDEVHLLNDSRVAALEAKEFFL